MLYLVEGEAVASLFKINFKSTDLTFQLGIYCNHLYIKPMLLKHVNLGMEIKLL